MRALHQLHAFSNSGVGRDAIEIAKLIDAHAESDADFRVGWARDTARDQVIELGLIAEATQHDLVRKTGIARVELRGPRKKQVGSIAALMDLAKNVKGGLARGGDQVLF